MGRPRQPGTATALAAATSDGTFHLAAVLNGQTHHRVRNPDGTWSPWGGLGNPGTATALAAATSTGTFHLAAVLNGQTHHRIRNPDGTWSPWGGRQPRHRRLDRRRHRPNRQLPPHRRQLTGWLRGANHCVSRRAPCTE